MKKNLLSIGLLAIALALTGCGDTVDESSSAINEETSSESSESETSITEEDLPTGQTTYIDEDGEEQQLNRDTLYRNASSPHVTSNTLDSGTTMRVLVVPFSFESGSSITADDDLRERIRITFDGTDEEMEEVGGNVSVRSFYEQSSFGKCQLEMTVLPCWVEYEGTPTAFKSAASSTGTGAYAANYVRTWYAEEYAKDGHGELGEDAEPWSYFDGDGDGYIDLIWTVYAYPYTSSNTDSDWWAYVTYTSNTANRSNPTIMTLAWASTNFMNSAYDSHTFIHETGHTLGMNDFYDYNSTWKPMGKVDYMDNNMGDHCAYSKFAYGWINPYVLREEDIDGEADENGVGEGVTSAVITLRASTLTGDALILASPDYNNTAFDEYLILELVGPYGLCESDYKSGYDSATGYTTPGIRMLHVDARTYSSSWSTPLTDADEIGQSGRGLRVCNTYGGRYGVGTDSDFWPHESTSGTEYSYFTEVSLVESSVTTSNWTTSPSYNASSATTLFQQGDRFSASSSSPWVQTYFPSQSNLWNKAKTVTGSPSSLNQTYEIDESVTCNYSFRVNSIVEDDEYGAIATITVSLI